MMISRRWHTKNLTDYVNTNIDFLVKVSYLIVHDIKARMSEIGMTKAVIDVNSTFNVFIASLVALVVEFRGAVSGGYHVNDPIVAFVSELNLIQADLVHHSEPHFFGYVGAAVHQTAIAENHGG